MTPEETKAKDIEDAVKTADAKKKADAAAAAGADADAGEKLDKILECLDSMGKRMDQFERTTVPAGQNGKAGEGDGEMEDEIEKGKPRELGADSIRRDSVEDAEEIEHFKAETGATHSWRQE